MKKIQAVRAGAGADITSSYKPDGEMLQERQKTNQGHRQSEEQHRSNYGKASIRNYRRMGPGHGEPGMFDPEGKRGKTIEKRREEHKARRGVKGAEVKGGTVAKKKYKGIVTVGNYMKKEEVQLEKVNLRDKSTQYARSTKEVDTAMTDHVNRTKGRHYGKDGKVTEVGRYRKPSKREARK